MWRWYSDLVEQVVDEVAVVFDVGAHEDPGVVPIPEKIGAWLSTTSQFSASWSGAVANAGKVRGLLQAVGEVKVLPVLFLWTHHADLEGKAIDTINGVLVVAPGRAEPGWSQVLHHDELDEFTVDCVAETLLPFAQLQKRGRIKL